MNYSKKTFLSKLIGLLLLAVAFSIIFICFAGGHFSEFGATAVITLIISFVMMIVPTIAWIIDHKHLNGKKGLRICMANSLVIFILAAIWPIITIIKNKPCNTSNTICEVQISWEILGLALLLAILYFLINICFWVNLSKTKKRGLQGSH